MRVRDPVEELLDRDHYQLLVRAVVGFRQCQFLAKELFYKGLQYGIYSYVCLKSARALSGFES